MYAHTQLGAQVKHKMSILIDEQIAKDAHDLGLNISKVCENALKIQINQLRQGYNQPLSLTGVSFGKEKPMAGGEGFEPSTPNLGDTEFWNRFRTHLTEKNYRGGYDSTLYNYALKYSDCLVKRDLSRIRGLTASMKPNVLKALSSLAKFSGSYSDWQQLLKQYGLNWGGRSTDDLLIDRLTKGNTKEDVWGWVKEVKEAKPNLSELLTLMALTGMRYIEAINSYHLIQKLSDEKRLTEYYNLDRETLEHYKFKEIFIRDNKKAFISFMPKETLNEIVQGAVVPSIGAVKKSIQVQKIGLRFGDIREAHGTLMIKYLKESEINFLHGRVASGVFMQHYFNPSLIGDLKSRAFQGIKEIQEKIK